MDAKSKADFINAVATGKMLPCPKCGTVNEADSKFCYMCGFKLTGADSAVFQPVTEQSQKATMDIKVSQKAMEVIDQTQQESPQDMEDDVPLSVFAEGLPAWDIVPPQVQVRRHKTK